MNNFIAQSYGKSMNYTDIPNRLFQEYNVKKGLRNEDGTGVRIGLTRVADVVGYRYGENHEIISIDGKLYYRGYSLTDLVNGKGDGSCGFEETAFLLLFGYLPTEADLRNFRTVLQSQYALPEGFLEMNLLRMPSPNLMNLLQQAVLSLYRYDETPDDLDVYQTVLKGINIMAKLPAIICYGYQSQMHCYQKKSLVIHYPREDYSIAENILYLLRGDDFTHQEAALLDTLLMIHADHGGGNNSTFTNVVISSTGTDIYSAVVGSIGSLKGPRHGGANIRCQEMLDAVRREIGLTEDEDKIADVIKRILNKNFYDNSGLIYGLGHAVYTLSDPRANILKEYSRTLAEEKDCMEEFEFMDRFERVAKATIAAKGGKPLSNNVDFYSGFAYSLLGIPKEMYTPLFVCSRMVGWLAHNVENKLYDGKMMRPATKYVGNTEDYVKMEER